MAQELRSEQFMKRALDAWSGAVFRLALAHTHCIADAQDVVQDVFFSLLESSVTFHDDEHEKAWLLHVATNRCREYHRSAWKRRVETTNDIEPIADRAVDDPQLEALFEHPVWAQLAQLPEKLRGVVHLCYVEGYSTDAAAEILGIRPSTVRTRLYRARKQLRDGLDSQPQTTTTTEGAHYEPQSF